MELKNFISVYDNFLSPLQVSAFLRTFKDTKFEDAGVLGNKNDIRVNKDIRTAQNYGLSSEKSFTEAHWFNFICYKIKNTVLKFCKEKEILINLKRIQELTILKYTEGGFYKPHFDNAPLQAPREFSVIVFLNNDYEGGNLVFYEPNHKDKILEVKPGVGKIVVWPSNYLFPHAAEPVKKGTRFVLVSWIV